MKFNPLMAAPPLVFLGLAVLFWSGLGGNDGIPPTGRDGDIAPALFVEPLGTLPELTHEALTAPGVKLVNYWASWCAPCRAEHPNLELLQSEGIPVFGVNYKDQPVNALAFLDELGNPFEAVGSDPAARTALEWGVAGVPETYVLDGTGRIILRFAGPVTQRSLEGVIRPALERAAAQTTVQVGE